MAEFLREHRQALLAAILLHIGVAALVVLAAQLNLHPAPPVQLAIQATIVDTSKLRGEAERKRQEDLAQQEKQRAAEEAAKAAQAKEEAQQQQQQQEQQKAQEEAAQQLQAQQQKQADAQRQADLEKQAAEAQRVAAEKEKLAEIARKQKEEADREKTAADAKAQASREADLQRQLQEEEGRAEVASSGLLNQYVAMIEQRIVRNWNRPLSATPGLECRVAVVQAPGGTVLSVQVDQCNGDAAVRQSIEAAVYRSSPLPPPPDPRLFERNLIFIFKPTA